MLRLSIVAGLLLAVLAMPAHAQRRGGGPAPKPPTPEELDKKRQEQAIDEQYRSTLQRMNTDSAPVRVDPWANARGPGNTKR